MIAEVIHDMSREQFLNKNTNSQAVSYGNSLFDKKCRVCISEVYVLDFQKISYVKKSMSGNSRVSTHSG